MADWIPYTAPVELERYALFEILTLELGRIPSLSVREASLIYGVWWLRPMVTTLKSTTHYYKPLELPNG